MDSMLLKLHKLQLPQADSSRDDEKIPLADAQLLFGVNKQWKFIYFTPTVMKYTRWDLQLNEIHTFLPIALPFTLIMPNPAK